MADNKYNSFTFIVKKFICNSKRKPIYSSNIAQNKREMFYSYVLINLVASWTVSLLKHVPSSCRRSKYEGK